MSGEKKSSSDAEPAMSDLDSLSPSPYENVREKLGALLQEFPGPRSQVERLAPTGTPELSEGRSYPRKKAEVDPKRFSCESWDALYRPPEVELRFDSAPLTGNRLSKS